MDLKSREIYEAPAAHVLLKLHRDLEQYCLTKDEVQFKKSVDAQVGVPGLSRDVVSPR